MAAFAYRHRCRASDTAQETKCYHLTGGGAESGCNIEKKEDDIGTMKDTGAAKHFKCWCEEERPNSKG